MYYSLSATNNGNRCNTPDAAANELTTALKITARISTPNWTPSTQQSIYGKYLTSGSNRAYFLNLMSGGLSLQICQALAGGGANYTVTTVVGLSANTITWVRADWNGIAKTLDFWIAADTNSNIEPAIWSRLGTQLATAAVTLLNNSAATLSAGDIDNATTPFVGKIYCARLYANAAATTPNQEFDPSRFVAPYNSMVASTGEVWTMQRSATEPKAKIYDKYGVAH